MSQDLFRRAVAAVVKRIKPPLNIIGELGDGAGNVYANFGMNILNVRVHGNQDKVSTAWWANAVNPSEGMLVDLDINHEASAPYGYIVKRISNSAYFYNDMRTAAVGAHAIEHELREDGTGGGDPVSIYERAVAPLRAVPHVPPDMSVYVEPGGFYIGENYLYFTGGDSPSFNPNGRSLDVLTLDADGLTIMEGAHAASDAEPYASPAVSRQLRILDVYLTALTTQLDESNTRDPRGLQTVMGAPAPGGNDHTHHLQTPAGDIDGSNVVFTLFDAPDPADSLQLYRNGLLLRAGTGNDYTLSGNTITFESGDAIPEVGASLFATYILNASGIVGPS